MADTPQKPRKYGVPTFLIHVVAQTAYDQWLQRKAAAHVRRDRKRGNQTAMIEAYKIAIHRAVLESNGRDYYTGEELNWTLISTYKNDESKAGRRVYKSSFALLPTVDHVGDGLGAADFKICAWRTNDAKNDLAASDFIELCRRVVNYHAKADEPCPADALPPAQRR